MDSTVKQRRAKEKKVTTNKSNVSGSGAMLLRIEHAIRSVPRGKVATYGGIAKAAGYPGAARQVAKVLRRSFGLPWQRILGAGGEIKLRGDSAIEQRLRLEAEGVRFRGRKVDMKISAFNFKRSAASEDSPERQSLTRVTFRSRESRK